MKNQFMKVLFVSHVSEKLGAGRSLLGLLKGLRQKGVECFVVMPRKGPITEELKKIGIKYSILPLKSWATLERRWLRLILRAILDLMVSVVIAIKAYLWGASVIYTNSSVIATGAWAALLTGKPHIWQIREFVTEHYGLRFILGERLSIKLINKLSFCVIVISEALKHKYSQYIPAKKLKMIYNPVNIVNGLSGDDRLNRSAVITLAIIGLIHPNKGQMDAILAVADLAKEGIRTKLKIIGKKSFESFQQQLKQAVIQNNIDEYVKFIDHTDNLSSLYSEVDIVLVCSRWEAFGRTTVEAMLFKKPVIGARSGATPELIKEGFNGLLYEPGDHQELAEKIKYLIEHPEEAKRMGENGFKEASGKYTIEKCADAVFDIFQKAVENKKP